MELIVNGASINIAVRGGCLSIKDGHREQRIERIPRIYDRLVIAGNLGIITGDAMLWMYDYGMSWCYLKRDHGPIGASIDGEGDPILWRHQVTVEPMPIIRRLLLAKLDGQARNAEHILRNPDAAKLILGYADKMLSADDHSTIMGYEGKAAYAYWRAWTIVNMPFIADHVLKVPPRWLSWDGRRSLAMNRSNRRADDPINALINYAYRVGETLCVQACYAVGLSPLLGLTHTKAHVRSRDGESPRASMALDLLEPLRPACDRVVLEMLDYAQGVIPYFRWHDFLELNTGVVRIEANEIKERIITECEQLQDEATKWAEDVTKSLRNKK